MTMKTEELPVDGVVGDRLRWLLDRLRTFEGPAVELGDTSAELKSDDPMGFFQWLSGQLDGFEVLTAVRDTDDAAIVTVACPNGRSWVLQVRLEGQEPRRIEWVQLDRKLLEGMELRPATEADAAGIREVCCGAPIVLRHETMTIDPGPRYFDEIRLMEFGATVLVVTHWNRIVAVHCGTFYPIVYGGQEQWMSQILHSRVLPEYAGLGLWSVMNRRLVNSANDRRREATDAGDPVFQNGCAYFSVENDATRRLNGAQATWSFQPYRVVLDCRSLVDGADGRPPAGVRVAEPADGPRIVALLNGTHTGEELFAPYTEASLAARLERAADVYSWGNVLLSDQAVVGTWMAGRTHTRRPKDEPPDSPGNVSVRALVLDYGFEAGAEGELVALLQVAAAHALDAGMTHLSLFTSDAARGSATLVDLAAEVERYELATPYTPEPEGAAERGLYVDQIYF